MKEIDEYFDYVKINLASPERIREWGHRVLPSGEIIGEVKNSETMNYRTFKPEMGGLFCEKIFGPEKSWECHCGKYKQVRHQGLFCEQCGVEITESRVRRHRMAYIDLSTPVTHVWYLKGVPSYLAYVLKMSLKDIEEIIYFNDELDNSMALLGGPIVNENKRSKNEIDLLGDPLLEAFRLDKLFTEDNEESKNEIDLLGDPLVDEDDFFLDRKTQKVGAEIIQDLLKKINLLENIKITRQDMLYTDNEIKLKRFTREIRILESFVSTKSKPEWMILTVLPVLPANLRPMVELEGKRYASSDLNELYRRVITRNTRLERLLKAYAPGVVVRAEKKLIQEAVDALIDNGKRGPKATDIHNRPLKSLADTVKGKQGRFRLNLLGKRVDYSGRSVIVVGPHLELNQCGLPYEIAIELFFPFLVHELINKNLAGTIQNAKKIIQSIEPKKKFFIWNLTKKIIEGHPILLNRAPTLHRLGVQAFQPILVDGRAIQLHPLVCPAFNADFDGDQMAVHLPLSWEAQLEAHILMLAPNNFLSPATGDPIIQPTQDMLLGSYYLTINNRSHMKGSSHYFTSFDDVLFAYDQKQLDIHSFVWVRCPTDLNFVDEFKLIKTVKFEDESKLQIYDNLQVRMSKRGDLLVQYLRTTPGRILFNQTLNTLVKD